MALYEFKEKDKTTSFMIGCPLVGFTIDGFAADGTEASATGTLEFRDVTEPPDSRDRNVKIKWKAKLLPDKDKSANWSVFGERESKLDKVSQDVSTALRALVTEKMNRFMAEQGKAAMAALVEA